ncbi:uncharacterized protein LOC117676298 [Pantherophis guttatus]|uniref:Uncharacterized protein LOC117676298 n=1 Tax=Pantherophis guttatus TaxID=94885 RepID=A0ABM3ZPJ0_PANGU|nr:uncharacterized protein LOC117676298 [Pantherophis guttatus]
MEGPWLKMATPQHFCFLYSLRSPSYLKTQIVSPRRFLEVHQDVLPTVQSRHSKRGRHCSIWEQRRCKGGQHLSSREPSLCKGGRHHRIHQRLSNGGQYLSNRGLCQSSGGQRHCTVVTTSAILTPILALLPRLVAILPPHVSHSAPLPGNATPSSRIKTRNAVKKLLKATSGRGMEKDKVHLLRSSNLNQHGSPPRKQGPWELMLQDTFHATPGWLISLASRRPTQPPKDHTVGELGSQNHHENFQEEQGS